MNPHDNTGLAPLDDLHAKAIARRNVDILLAVIAFVCFIVVTLPR